MIKKYSPPQINLVLIRSKNIELAADFYRVLGVVLVKEKHGNGPEHYSSCENKVVFEIYPLANEQNSMGTRIGFMLDDLDGCIIDLKKMNAMVIQEPYDSEWGRRAVISDLDGHAVEPLERTGS